MQLAGGITRQHDRSIGRDGHAGRQDRHALGGRPIDRLVVGDRKLLQLLAVVRPEANDAVAAAAGQFALWPEGHVENATGDLAVGAGGPRGRVSIWLRDRRPAILHVPPDDQTVFTARGDHAAVAPPRECSDRALVLRERQHDSSRPRIPQMDVADPVAGGQ